MSCSALRAATLVLPLACGCASVGGLASAGHATEAWALACEQQASGAALSPDQRDALRTAIHQHTNLAIQARVSEPARFFARMGSDILNKPALVVQMSVAASSHPGAGVRVVPSLRLASGVQSARAGNQAWSYAGVSAGTPDGSARYSLLGALGDALAAVVGQNPMWRGTASILPERIPGDPPVGTEAQILAFSAIGAAGGGDCFSRLGERCESVLLMVPGAADAGAPRDLPPIDLGIQGPTSGDALELHVVQAGDGGGEYTCNVQYTVAVPLPAGATLGARVQAALPSAGSAGAPEAMAPPADAALPLVEQGHLIEACKRMEKEDFPTASFAERQDRARALRALDGKLTLSLTGHLRTPAEIHSAIGAPLLRGEIVPVALSITLSGPDIDYLSADFSLRHDGSLWQSALRHPAAHDAVGLLFGTGSGTGLPTSDAATSAAGDPQAPETKRAALELQILDQPCAYSVKPTCEATLPLARSTASMGPETLMVEAKVRFGANGDCALPMTWSTPLPAGASLQDRLSTLLARGAVKLALQ